MNAERLNEIWKELGFTGECPYGTLSEIENDEFNALSASDKLRFKCLLGIAKEVSGCLKDSPSDSM